MYGNDGVFSPVATSVRLIILISNKKGASKWKRINKIEGGTASDGDDDDDDDAAIDDDDIADMVILVDIQLLNFNANVSILWDNYGARVSTFFAACFFIMGNKFNVFFIFGNR